MKSKSQLEKWGSGILGVLCLILVANLVFRGSSKPGSTRPATSAMHPSAATHARSLPTQTGDELSRYDPAVQLDALKEIMARPEPKIGRNPFEFPAKEAPPQPKREETASGPGTPAPPAAPPPPPLKAVGFTEKSGGVREAIVSLEDEIFVIHEGETFAKRFKVLKITPSQIEVNDETTQQNIRLPFG